MPDPLDDFFRRPSYRDTLRNEFARSAMCAAIFADRRWLADPHTLSDRCFEVADRMMEHVKADDPREGVMK